LRNIAALLKSEISRLSRRKFVRKYNRYAKLAATHRREIAALKRTIAALGRRAQSLAKAASRQNYESGVSEEMVRPSFFIDSFVSALAAVSNTMGSDAAEIAMPALPVVEHLDVVEHIASCFLACAVDPVAHAPFLQAAEERLGNRVVPTVAAAAGAHFDAAKNRCQSSLPYCTPWSEWIVNGAFGRRRQIGDSEGGDP
jgi:hypothetical protein